MARHANPLERESFSNSLVEEHAEEEEREEGEEATGCSNSVPVLPLSSSSSAGHRHVLRKLCTADCKLSSPLPQDPASSSFVIAEPWTDGERWPEVRIWMFRMLHSRAMDVLMTIMISFNIFVIIRETDYEANCFPAYANNPAACPYRSAHVPWIKFANWSLLLVYSIEILLRLYTERLDYLAQRYNQFDILVVVIAWFSEVASFMINLSFLRIFRIARLTRGIRLLLNIRELYLLVNGILSSMKAIFFGTTLIMLMLVAYSIVLVAWVHPVNSQLTFDECSWCSQGFSSVWNSVMTLFQQLIAGDSWIMSFPLVQHSIWIPFLMIIIVSTVALGAMNLILTVVVERAAEAREQDTHEQARLKAKSQFDIKKKLMRICRQMDTSRNGLLSLDELLAHFDTNREFRNFMTLLDVDKVDMESLFRMLDIQGSGELEFEDFCEELIQLQSNDLRLTMAMTRFNVNHIRATIDQQLHVSLEEAKLIASGHQQQIQSIGAKLDKVLACLDPGPEPKCQAHQVQVCEIDKKLKIDQLHESIPHSEAVLQEKQDEIQKLLLSQSPCQPDLVSSAFNDILTMQHAGAAYNYKDDLVERPIPAKDLIHIEAAAPKPPEQTHMPMLLENIAANIGIIAKAQDSTMLMLKAVKELVPMMVQRRLPPSPLSYQLESEVMPKS